MKSYFLDTREAIPEVLKLFAANEINATWATVGFLFARNKKQLLEFSPQLRPTYNQEKLSYYNYFDKVGEDEGSDPFHFAGSLIEMIIRTKGQELASHTFAHYYCNEMGQTIDQFDADLRAAQAIAKENYDLRLESLVFPRNQFNQEYIKVASSHGIKTIRSNPSVWFWEKGNGRLTPLFRALDTLGNISKTLTFSDDEIVNSNDVIHLPASRFFRPYSDKEKIIQHVKLTRIKNEMTYAAKNNRNYHLWWHPHNFGNDVPENMKQLKYIIDHFNTLREKYDFQSRAMRDFTLD